MILGTRFLNRVQCERKSSTHSSGKGKDLTSQFTVNLPSDGEHCHPTGSPQPTPRVPVTGSHAIPRPPRYRRGRDWGLAVAWAGGALNVLG